MSALLPTLRIALGFERAVKDSRTEHSRSALLQHFELEAIDRVERGPCLEVAVIFPPRATTDKRRMAR